MGCFTAIIHRRMETPSCITLSCHLFESFFFWIFASPHLCVQFDLFNFKLTVPHQVTWITMVTGMVTFNVNHFRVYSSFFLPDRGVGLHRNIDMLLCLYVHAVVSPSFSSQVSKRVNCRDSKTPAIKRLHWYVQGFCFVDCIIHLARPDQTCCLESLETVVSTEILDHF